MSQIDPVHAPPFHCLKIHLNVILSFTTDSRPKTIVSEVILTVHRRYYVEIKCQLDATDCYVEIKCQLDATDSVASSWHFIST